MLKFWLEFFLFGLKFSVYSICEKFVSFFWVEVIFEIRPKYLPLQIKDISPIDCTVVQSFYSAKAGGEVAHLLLTHLQYPHK